MIIFAVVSLKKFLMNEYQWNGSFFTMPFITEGTTVAIYNATETNLLIQCESISLRAYEPTSLRV